MENQTLSPLQLEINAAFKEYNSEMDEPYKIITEKRKQAYDAYKALELEINKEFEDIKREVERPLVNLIEKYYDECLLDVDGEPVKIGAIIFLNGKFLKVTGRYMNTKGGEFQFNPRVVAERVSGGKPGNKIEINSTELKYWVVYHGAPVKTTGEEGQA